MTNIHGGRFLAAAAVLALAVLPAAPAVAAEPETATISGTFTTAAGAPVADAGVSVHATGATADGWPTRTAADGTWAVGDLAPGTYKIEFWVQDDTTNWTQWVPRQTVETRAATFTVTAGQTLVVDESRFPAGALALSFKDPAGEPIGAFCGEAVGARFLREGCTDTGTLTLDDLPAGRYAVRLTEAGRFGLAMPVVVANAETPVTVTARG